MSFVKDLAAGEDVEKEFQKFIENLGWVTGRNTSQTVTEKRFYDVWAQLEVPTKAKKRRNRPVLTFELKLDRRAIETGNVFLEHESLENSRADYIVYKIDNTFYIQDRPTVINIMSAPQFEVKSGTGYSDGTLVPLELFQKLFTNAEKAFVT